MATFPLLSTGAVTQYPGGAAQSQQVAVVQFLDAADQRWLVQGKQLRRWQIRLDLLTEQETITLEQFFSAQMGEYSTFTFTDPMTRTAVPNCRIGAPQLTTEYIDVNHTRASLWIVETNG